MIEFKIKRYGCNIHVLSHLFYCERCNQRVRYLIEDVEIKY